MNLTVVMPAYNEQDNLRPAVAEVKRHVLDVVPGSELVVVDDGSRDGTPKILDDLAAENGSIRVIHQPNRGHGPAVRTGLDAAAGEFVFLIDSDRQIPLDAFGELWQAAGQGDGAFGRRRRRHDHWSRKSLTRLIRWTVPLVFGVRVHDANAPCKIVRRALWQDARPFIPPDTLAPSLFLALFAFKRGYRIAEIDVPHLPRVSGVVSIRRWKLLKFCAWAFVQLLRFRLRIAWAGQRGS